MFGRAAPRCPRCHDAVYSAEEVLGAGQKWHSACFTCKSCKKGLSSTTLTEKDKEIYCNNCYARLFGPKGFGIGGTTVVTGVSVADKPGTSATVTVTPSASSSSVSSSASGKCACGHVNAAGAKFCGECGKPVTASSSTATAAAAPSWSKPSPSSSSSSSAPPPSVASLSSNYSSNSSSSSSSSSSSTLASTNKPAFGTVTRPTVPKFGAAAADKCGKCGDSVYAAERVSALGKHYHDSCFRCSAAGCGTRLSSTIVNDHETGLYCNACYAKKFGPKGYGFGGGSAQTLAYTR